MLKCVFINKTISKLKLLSLTYNFWDVIKKLKIKHRHPIAKSKYERNLLN